VRKEGMGACDGSGASSPSRKAHCGGYQVLALGAAISAVAAKNRGASRPLRAICLSVTGQLSPGRPGV
jgi:hypothetical protein